MMLSPKHRKGSIVGVAGIVAITAMIAGCTSKATTPQKSITAPVVTSSSAAPSASPTVAPESPALSSTPPAPSAPATPTASSSPTASATPTASPTTKAPATPTVSPSNTASSQPTLRQGDQGAAVQALQQQLGITADGKFGAGTDAAVRALQARYGLVTDGVVGSSTWKVLSYQGSMSSILASFDPRVVAAAKQTGWAIELHLHGNTGNTRVLHYTNGTWSLPVASRSSSAGWARDQHGVLKHYTTCTGVHYLYKADPNGVNAYSSEYGHASMAWAHYWCGGDAFHQDGYYDSHGCVHLKSYDDAHLIWTLPEGTYVLSLNT